MTTTEATKDLHTPGPWTFEAGMAEHDQHAINADQDGGGTWRAVATVHTGRLGGGSRPVQPAEAEANARMMAASPELLAACEAVMRAARLVPCKNGGEDAYEGEPGSMSAGKWRAESSIDGWIARLRAAIAKARGAI